MTISLTWKREKRTSGIPFKFNRIWLQDPAFNKLVIEYWNQEDKVFDLDGWRKFADKLHRLKSIVKTWQKDNKSSLDKELRDIENKIQ